MAKLSELKSGLQLTNLLPGETVTLIDVTWHGPTALEIAYKRADGQPATQQILYEKDAVPLTVRQPQTTWDFSASGDDFRLTAEAYRIHLAHLFDPVLAVHTSLIEPLPHQITAVYGEMLARQPLRYLLADEERARVVVLPPEANYKRQVADTAAGRTAVDILNNRGSSQRYAKNMLLFIAPDAGDMEALVTAVRDYLAWQSIQIEEEPLNLDKQQSRQMKNSLEKADETVNSHLQETYAWLLTPVQQEPLGPIELQANRISGSDNFYERAGRKLKQDSLLITKWSPDTLRMELDQYIWNDERGWSVNLKTLWEYLTRYCHFPRLLDQSVLLNAVRDGIARLDAPFAYATGLNAEGYHTELVFRQHGAVYFYERSLLIHPDHVNQPPPPEPVKVIEPKGAARTYPWLTRTIRDQSQGQAPSRRRHPLNRRPRAITAGSNSTRSERTEASAK